MLMLSLNDAVSVCMSFLHETTYFDDMPSEEYESMPEFIKNAFEQKCWFPPETSESAKRLNDLIFDINPAEICSQIESDNLKNWCEIVQAEMKMAMVQFPFVEPERRTGRWIRTSTNWFDGDGGEKIYPYHCSECNHETYSNFLSDYCPNCGAKMEAEYI